HGNVHVLGRSDASEMNVESVSEHQHVALFQIRLDILLIHISLQLIVDQNHDDIRSLCGLCSCVNLKSLFLSLRPGFASLIQTNDNMASGILGVQCVCVSLAAVSDNSDGLAIQQRQVTVILIKNSCFL